MKILFFAIIIFRGRNINKLGMLLEVYMINTEMRKLGGSVFSCLYYYNFYLQFIISGNSYNIKIIH